MVELGHTAHREDTLVTTGQISHHKIAPLIVPVMKSSVIAEGRAYTSTDISANHIHLLGTCNMVCPQTYGPGRNCGEGYEPFQSLLV